MKKRVLSLFMALVLCLTLLPAPALAVTDTADAQDTGTEDMAPQSADVAVNSTYVNGKDTAMQNGIAVQDAETTENVVAKVGDTGYTSLPAALSAAQDGETVTLLADHTTDENDVTTRAVVTKTLTLDLNGFVLKITGSGSVIKIESGTLTLVDSHPAAIHKFVKNTGDLWMLDESQGAGIVRGGIITGGNAGYNDGGGVYVCPGAGLVMRGGSIVGCKAQQGGGVYVADKNEAKTLGRFTMEGGSIAGCVATDESYSGGGVATHGDFTMTGGTIRSCTATAGHGGGICSVRQLHISGSAVVTDCKAGGSYASSGAMLISPDSTYTAIIAGGTFDGNVVNNKSTTITGGTFSGQVQNSGVIENGQFNGAVNNYEGTIKGGTFNGSVKNENDYDDGVLRRAGTISGGTFNGTVTNEAAGRISGGTYNGSVYGTFYTVAFVSNGGTAVPNQKHANTPVTAPTVSRAGYTLVGWYTDEACTAAYDFTKPVTDSVTLYAKWEAAPRYYYNSGTTTDTDNADKDKKGSPKTFDPGAGIYAVSVALSLAGMAYVSRKKQ